jgi:hypothetical protein
MGRWPIRFREASDRQALLDASGHDHFLVRLVRAAPVATRTLRSPRLYTSPSVRNHRQCSAF